MAQFSVTFPQQTFVVEARDPQEAACLAAFELARQCEGRLQDLATVRDAVQAPWTVPGRIPETGVHGS